MWYNRWKWCKQIRKDVVERPKTVLTTAHFTWKQRKENSAAINTPLWQ